jgi:hypothetical protein
MRSVLVCRYLHDHIFPNLTWALTAFAGTIAMMESQIETMRGSIAALKGSKPPKEKKKKEKREKAPVASSSKATGKQPKTASKKKGKKPVADDDVLTFEQKKDLSESIGKLDGTKLEKVIQIIHEGVPEIRDVRSIPVVIFHTPDHGELTNRARRKSNWRLTCCQRWFSPSCIISFFGLCARLQQSEQGQAKARALGVLNGRAWMRTWRQRRFGSWRRGWHSSRMVQVVQVLLLAESTIANIRQTQVLDGTVLAVTRSNGFFHLD